MGDGVPTLPVLRDKWVTKIFVENGFHIYKVASLIKKLIISLWLVCRAPGESWR
jgi:hypothetical protein